MSILMLWKVNGQNQFNLENKIIKNSYVSFAKIKTENTKKIFNETDKTNLLRVLTEFDGNISFQKIDSQRIGTDIFQEKFQLRKNGIKIRGGEYLIHQKNMTLDFVHGFMAPFVKELPINNEINKKNCIKKALSYFEGENKQKNISSIKEASLIYYFNYKINSYQLAYQIEIFSTKSLRAENVFISANSEEFLGAESLICNVNFPGIAETQYNGFRNIVTDANTGIGPFRLQELRNNVLIRTRNNNDQFLEVAGATELWDNDNNWTFNEHVNDQAALDAHWAAETVYDYWLNTHNRNSIDGNGMPIETFVHVSEDGVNSMFNAFWFSNRMYYGDGINGNNPLTALDICGHEVGHGIDQFTGDLKYERESGALDEGFADIWGACVEAQTTPNKQRWLLGEDVLGGPLRSMSNPNQFGQPDTYLGDLWANTDCGTPTRANDYCGVHTNSGVLNFWFFLLSEGGTGTNDINNSYNVNGLGIEVAAQIAYRTKLLMNNSFSGYNLCREMSIQAAIQLFGSCSNEVAQVVNAWFAVGVGDSNLPNPPITNVILSSYYHIAHTNGKVRFTVNWQPANAQPTEIRWYNAATNQLLATTPGYINNFEWTPNCPSKPKTNNTDCISVYATVVGCNTVQSNTVGGNFNCFYKTWSTLWSCPLYQRNEQIEDEPMVLGGLKIYPNPATTSFTISHGAVITKIRIIDKTGRINKVQFFSNQLKNQSISTIGLKPDVYTVIVSDGEKEYTTKLIVL